MKKCEVNCKNKATYRRIWSDKSIGHRCADHLWSILSADINLLKNFIKDDRFYELNENSRWTRVRFENG